MLARGCGGIVLLAVLLRTLSKTNLTGFNTTVNTDVTMLNTTCNVKHVNDSTVSSVTHRPDRSGGVHDNVVVTTTLIRNMTLFTIIIYVLDVLGWAVCYL